MAGSVLAIVEQRDGKYRKSAFEIVTAANEIAGQVGTEVVALVIGADSPEHVGHLGAFGAKKVLSATDETCANYVPEAYTQAVVTAIEQEQAEFVFFAASAMGKDLAPRVAAKLGVGLAADCTKLEIVDGSLVTTRPVYAGKAFLTIGFKESAKMATLRPNVFTANEVAAGSEAESAALSFNPGEPKTVVKEFRKTGGDKIELTEADVIVSGGRGLKEPDNFKVIEELASELGAAVGASRAAVDAGWRPHSEQVGQTGKTVSPNLYIAVGISGAIQHLAGMSSSKVIVAINKDPDAPIFSKADYGVVGDLFSIVPALTEEIKKIKS
jgi:electron transfer flavoprotein alpha subunit